MNNGSLPVCWCGCGLPIPPAKPEIIPRQVFPAPAEERETPVRGGQRWRTANAAAEPAWCIRRAEWRRVNGVRGRAERTRNSPPRRGSSRDTQRTQDGLRHVLWLRLYL
jgi:hypothetical protein